MANIIMSGGTIVDTKKKLVYRNGETFKIPPYIKGRNTTTINGTVYIDGYKLLKNGKWRLSLAGIFHMFF